MKFSLRNLFLIGGILAATASGFAAPILGVTAVTSSVSTATPGTSVNFTVTISNTATGANDFAGGNGDFAVQLTSTSATTINAAAQLAVAIPAITAGSTATVLISGFIPLSTSQAAGYAIKVAVTNSATPVAGFTTAAGSFAVTGKPDFQITSLTYTAGTAYQGGNVIPISLTWTNRISTNGVTNVPFVPSMNGNSNFFRIDVVLSSNPTFGDSDDLLLTVHDISTTENADGVNRTISWNQLLPGNFAGTYYVMAKIDSLSGVSENVDNDLFVNGNNTWFSPDTNGTRITLLPTNFATVYWASTSSNAYSDNPSISADGRYTAFASDATNLGTGDTNGVRDIFLFDNQTSTVRRLNLSQQGAQANAASNNPSLSAAGGYVAFSSDATNLVLGDTNGFSDIFVVNTLTGAITLDSISSAGTQANGSNYKPSLSSDGRYLVFESNATNLVGTTAVGTTHIYLRDRTTGTTTLVSQSTAGAAANGNSLQPVISADGTYVAFASDATNLVAGDSNGVRDIFLRSIGGSTTIRVSVHTTGTQGNGASRAPSISQDGSYVAFGSEATNLVAADSNGISDIFVYSRTSATTTRVSVSSAGTQATDPSSPGFQLGSVNPSISATGRYVTFASLADNLTIGGDSLGQYLASDANRAVDIFVVDRDVSGGGTFDTPGNISTTMASVNRFGYQTVTLLGIPSTAASDIYPVISADGRWVALPSDAESTAGLVHGATNRTSPDTNSFRDVFLHDRRINALPNPGTLPVVTITNPGNSSAVLVNTPISVTASATTTTGVVSSVQFYVNGTSLGTSTVFPYTQAWTPTAVGTYTLSALVTDSFGNVGVSSNIAVTVNAAPSIGITGPVGGTSATLGATQTITATASPTTPGATVSNVQFYANGVSLGTVSSAPYSVSWTPASAGSYALTAIATDSNGTQSTSPAVAFTVNSTSSGPGVSPGVALTSPLSGSSYVVGTPITLSATASLGGGLVSSVNFFANGSPVGSSSTAPFSATFTPNATGTYSFTAVAVDSTNAQTTSSAVAVSVVAATAPTVAISSPANNSTVRVNIPQMVTATAASTTATIVSVNFFANNVSVGSDTSYPYTTTWTPAGVGTYSFTAVATDSLGVVSTSVPVTYIVSAGTPPSVTISTPTNGASAPSGSPLTVTAVATSTGSTIASVQFFANGLSIGSRSLAPYTISWTPAAAGSYSIIAIATDISGVISTSAPITVAISGNNAPTVAFTIPATGTNVNAGNAVTLAAVASDPDGTIASVRFLANGIVVGTSSAAPFGATWTPTASGAYTLIAQATDNSGNVTDSAAITVTVGGNSLPTVSVTSPRAGSTVAVGTSTTITASAADADGTIASVQFYANGVSVGTDTVAPYSATWTPNSEGFYRLTAVATDSSNAAITSSSVLILAAVAGSGSLDTVASGLYIDTAAFSSGEFTAINLHNRSTTFIAYGGTKTFYFANIPTDGSGNFELTDGAGAVVISGKFSSSGVSGTFADGANSISFSGANTVSTGSTTVGFYNGSVSDHLSSALAGIVGLNGRITLYVKDGTLTDAGSTTIDSAGGFTLRTKALNKFVGTADPVTGLLTGTLTKYQATAGDSFTGAQASGSTFSDGSLRNISSRVLVGTGDRILIAGFVLNGATPKTVLIRALGPTLTGLGVAGALADPALYLFNQSGTQIASNDNWSTGGASVTSASTIVGAYALQPSTHDSALLATLNPGVYSAQVSGVGGTTGVALLELYDVDSVAAYAAEKMVNISTRGQVGTGDGVMIAGFVVNGTSPKKVLVRGVGPTLSGLGVTGALADPVLRIVRQNGTLVRENNDWGVGNDVNLVLDASVKVGAYPLPAGSKDAVVLMNLMPGVYSAQLSGASSGTGVGLIEVYEVQ